MSAANLRETATPPSGELIIGRYDEGPDYAVRRSRGARSWLLLWTEEGSGHIGQGGADFLAGAGDLVVLAPGVRQTYRTAAGAGHWEFWWIHFQLRPHWEPWLRPYDLGSGVALVRDVHAGARPAIAAALRQAHADTRWVVEVEGAPPSPVAAGQRTVPASVATMPTAELAVGGIERVLLLATQARQTTATTDARVRRARATIDADPSGPHTVASLAAAAALSPSRFAHLFVQQTGSTPMAAVREARLRHATALLGGTALTVEQVAVASGFKDPFHFSHAFRRRYGVSPRGYRSERS